MHILAEDIKMFCSTGCTFNDVGCQDNVSQCSPRTNALLENDLNLWSERRNANGRVLHVS